MVLTNRIKEHLKEVIICFENCELMKIPIDSVIEIEGVCSEEVDDSYYNYTTNNLKLIVKDDNIRYRPITSNRYNSPLNRIKDYKDIVGIGIRMLDNKYIWIKIKWIGDIEDRRNNCNGIYKYNAMQMSKMIYYNTLKINIDELGYYNLESIELSNEIKKLEEDYEFIKQEMNNLSNLNNMI